MIPLMHWYRSWRDWKYPTQTHAPVQHQVVTKPTPARKKAVQPLPPLRHIALIYTPEEQLQLPMLQRLQNALQQQGVQTHLLLWKPNLPASIIAFREENVEGFVLPIHLKKLLKTTTPTFLLPNWKRYDGDTTQRRMLWKQLQQWLTPKSP